MFVILRLFKVTWRSIEISRSFGSAHSYLYLLASEEAMASLWGSCEASMKENVAGAGVSVSFSRFCSQIHKFPLCVVLYFVDILTCSFVGYIEVGK